MLKGSKRLHAMLRALFELIFRVPLWLIVSLCWNVFTLCFQGIEAELAALSALTPVTLYLTLFAMLGCVSRYVFRA